MQFREGDLREVPTSKNESCVKHLPRSNQNIFMISFTKTCLKRQILIRTFNILPSCRQKCIYRHSVKVSQEVYVKPNRKGGLFDRKQSKFVNNSEANERSIFSLRHRVHPQGPPSHTILGERCLSCYYIESSR